MSTFSIGCAAESRENLQVPAPDVTLFETEVYPLMLRDCGFVECHGSTQRFFQVFGPGRVRMNNAKISESPLAAEIEHTYDRARSMLANRGDIHEALLLLKPLDVSAGGAGHEGLGVWGQDVYPNYRDERFLVLFRWAATGSAVTWPYDGGTPPQEGVAAPQEGVAAPQEGVAAPQEGVAAPQEGVAP